MGKIKIYPEDSLFSKYIRARDGWKCQRCFTQYEEGDQGLQNSHFWSRRHWSTRFDPENCDALCYGCHALWETEKQGAYRDWKLNQLGEEVYKELMRRAQSVMKKDRKKAMQYVRELMKTL